MNIRKIAGILLSVVGTLIVVLMLALLIRTYNTVNQNSSTAITLPDFFLFLFFIVLLLLEVQIANCKGIVRLVYDTPIAANLQQIVFKILTTIFFLVSVLF